MEQIKQLIYYILYRLIYKCYPLILFEIPKKYGTYNKHLSFLHHCCYIAKSSVIFVLTSLISLNCFRYLVRAYRLMSLLLPVYSLTGTPFEYYTRCRQVELEITMISFRSLPVPNRMFRSRMCRSSSRSK